MVSHTYQIRLEGPVLYLPDVDDLLGKDVEVTVRELPVAAEPGNADAIGRLLSRSASADFFRDIEDPVVWQKQVRDEWE